jgi:hypothetical protein
MIASSGWSFTQTLKARTDDELAFSRWMVISHDNFIGDRKNKLNDVRSLR